MPKFRVTFFHEGTPSDTFEYDTVNPVIAYNLAVTEMQGLGKNIPQEYRIINLDRSPPSAEVPLEEA